MKMPIGYREGSYVMRSIADMSTSEMAAEYNKLTGQKIKKFGTREEGERRLAGARESYFRLIRAGNCEPLLGDGEPVFEPEQPEPEEPEQPEPEELLPEELLPEELLPEELRPDGSVMTYQSVGLWPEEEVAKPVPYYRTHLSPAERSQAIARSWRDPEVRQARSRRYGVEVVGHGHFKSIPAAFEALGIPLNSVTGFRGKLIRGESNVFSHDGVEYEFRILDGDELIQVKAESKRRVYVKLTPEQRGDAVRRIWENPATRVSMRARHQVEVAGEGKFRSVPAAFDHLRLPMQAVGTFRKQLVRGEKNVFIYGDRKYEFRILQGDERQSFKSVQGPSLGDKQ